MELDLAMDRYYLAEDGNVWLSFPSSERNKIQEDMYLILKKQHDSDTFVSVKARYKVLDISNDAPDFIKLIKKSVGAASCKAHSSNIPQIGSTTFKFLGPDPLTNPSFAAAFTSDGLIQIERNSQKTEKYEIVSGGYTGEKDNKLVEYADSLHEHFVYPCKINNGNYMPPMDHGYSIEMKEKSVNTFLFPNGEYWSKN